MDAMILGSAISNGSSTGCCNIGCCCCMCIGLGCCCCIYVLLPAVYGCGCCTCSNIYFNSLSKSQSFEGIVPQIFDYINHSYLSSWGHSRPVIKRFKFISFTCISMIVVPKGFFQEVDIGISKYSDLGSRQFQLISPKFSDWVFKSHKVYMMESIPRI